MGTPAFRSSASLYRSRRRYGSSRVNRPAGGPVSPCDPDLQACLDYILSVASGNPDPQALARCLELVTVQPADPLTKTL